MNPLNLAWLHTATCKLGLSMVRRPVAVPAWSNWPRKRVRVLPVGAVQLVLPPDPLPAACARSTACGKEISAARITLVWYCALLQA
eukprot:1139236-Pelagomonas_calceolata.AAC.1